MFKNTLSYLCIFITFCSISQCVNAQDSISDAFFSIVKKFSWEQAHGHGDNGLVSRIDALQFEKQENKLVQYNAVELPTQNPNETHPHVRVENGLLKGESVEGSHAFYSIPFAKPPVGELRFMPPEPAEDFGSLDVSTRTKIRCWQDKKCDADEPNCAALMSEDCLVLNINVPSKVDLSDPDSPPSDTLPVLVWFYGGFFYEGHATSTKYDGRWLSKAIDAIIVTVNYRVGALGFLSFEDEVGYVEGNQGIKDQQLALQWIQDNIIKFGGDKSRVTLFGNSAGSQSIIFHYTSSVSDPLFSRGIIESSPTVFQYQTPQDSMNTITRRLQESISGQNNVTSLRNANPQVLMDAQTMVIAKSIKELDLWGAIEPYRPVIDGKEFTDQPLMLFKNGKWQSNKEIMIGTNDDEMAYIREGFEFVGIPLPRKLFELINNFLLDDEYEQNITDLYEGGRGDLNMADNAAQEITDLLFICPNRALARFASESSTHPDKRVYLYNLAYALTVENCKPTTDFPPVCGNPYHSSEVIFVFKSPQGFGTNFTEADERVSDMISTYWGSFAKAGDPSSGLTSSLGEFTSWPIYNANTNYPWTNIRLSDTQSIEETEYRKEYCDLWDKSGYYFNNYYQPDVTSTVSPSDTSYASNNHTIVVTEAPNEVSSAAYTEPKTSISLTTPDLPQDFETTTGSATNIETLCSWNLFLGLSIASTYISNYWM